MLDLVILTFRADRAGEIRRGAILTQVLSGFSPHRFRNSSSESLLEERAPLSYTFR